MVVCIGKTDLCFVIDVDGFRQSLRALLVQHHVVIGFSFQAIGPEEGASTHFSKRHMQRLLSFLWQS